MSEKTFHIAYEERGSRFKCRWAAMVTLKHPSGRETDFGDYGCSKEEARDNLLAALRRAFELSETADVSEVETVSVDWNF